MESLDTAGSTTTPMFLQSLTAGNVSTPIDHSTFHHLNHRHASIHLSRNPLHKRNTMLNHKGFDDQDQSPTYKIVRFYSDRNREYQIIKRGVSLTEAQTHCSDPRTRQEGIWFDAYTAENINPILKAA